ncbi:MAG: L-malate glycosyltransferase, partial [Gaiellales bacterium]|nr:L-malate glycosyltransferase [Gaiellales bacterium]
MARRRVASSRPRVLFAVGSLFPVGGCESQVVEIMCQLHGQALDATLVTAGVSDRGVLRVRLDEAGIPVVSTGRGAARGLLAPPMMASRYARVMAGVRPHVVYPWLEETSLYLVPIARCLGVPSVVARRNISGADVERIPLAGWAIRGAEAMADVVTANSQAVLEEAQRRGISPDKLRLVRNAHPDLPPLAPPDGPPVMGYVANFRHGKGQLRFVEAISRLPRELPWTARFAGDGGTMPAVRERVAQVSLEDRVEFHGRIDDPRSFWAHCHIAVLLSDHEGSPNALIEAGYAGRPIVATRVGGTPEIVENGAGWLVGPNEDPTAMAAILRRLLTDPALVRDAGRRAHRHVSRVFSLRESVEGHRAAIEDALAG